MKSCLTEGFPFVFGFPVYESIYDEQTVKEDKAHLPYSKNEKLLGGHAVLCVGYSEKDKHFICINSWGKEWGENGCFYMPYDYMMVGDDFWSVRKVVEDDITN
jgi:C1A family cysteine protease